MSSFAAPPAPSNNDLQALAARTSLLELSSPVFLTGSYTVATLPAPSSSNVGKYATVTDLYGPSGSGFTGINEVVRCRQVGAAYYWVPQRTNHAAIISGDASMALGGLMSPPNVILNGTLTAARTLTMSTAKAYPGDTVDVAFKGGLGLFSLTIAGLNLGATLSLLAGGRKRVLFDGANWQDVT